MGSRGDSHFDMNTLQHFRLWIDETDEADQQQQQMQIDQSLRFKLLQARNENLPDFKDCKRVPAYDYLVNKNRGPFKVTLISIDARSDERRECLELHGSATRRK